MFKKWFNYVALALVLASLTGCLAGSAGSSSGPVASTLSFPLKSGFTSLFATGWTKNFTVLSGTSCNGTGSYTVTPAVTAATFEGISALSGTATLTGGFTNCAPASFTQTSTSYYDATTYAQLGFSSPLSYAVYANYNAPTSVKVGDTGNIRTDTIYADATKSVTYATQVVSYIVEADTASTAIVNVICKTYDTVGNLVQTEQDRFRIAASGALTLLTMDIKSTTSHELYTFN